MTRLEPYINFTEYAMSRIGIHWIILSESALLSEGGRGCLLSSMILSVQYCKNMEIMPMSNPIGKIGANTKQISSVFM